MEAVKVEPNSDDDSSELVCDDQPYHVKNEGFSDDMPVFPMVKIEEQNEKAEATVSIKCEPDIDVKTCESDLTNTNNVFLPVTETFTAPANICEQEVDPLAVKPEPSSSAEVEVKKVKEEPSETEGESGRTELIYDNGREGSEERIVILGGLIISGNSLNSEMCSVTCTKDTSVGQPQFHDNTHSFQCDVCNKTFSRSANLKRHKMVHTGERPFSCNICSKTFYRSCDLKQHSNIHGGRSYSYSCDICKRKFFCKAHLKEHQLVHTDECSVSCEKCNKKFKYKKNLKVHELTHSGERPFSCNLCEMSFKRKSVLKNHQLVHAGEDSL